MKELMPIACPSEIHISEFTKKEWKGRLKLYKFCIKSITSTFIALVSTMITPESITGGDCKMVGSRIVVVPLAIAFSTF
jgi:hypothetical protein